MCFHDGPGIRTTIFLKGCSIHCPWCANPENIFYEIQEYTDGDSKGIYGKDCSSIEIKEEIYKDINFIKRGGVTFSGGEPLLQSKDIVDLCKELKKDELSVFLETALFVSTDNIKMVAPFIDGAIVDIKILREDVCREVLGGNIEQYRRNVEVLYKMNKIHMFRIPCNLEYTMSPENRKLIQQFLCDYKSIPVQIFSIHNLAEKKYNSLDMKMWSHQKVDEEMLMNFCEELRKMNINAEIIKL